MDEELTVEDLNLDMRDLIVPASRGARKKPFNWTYIRDLTTEDIILLQANPVRGVTTPSIQKLKQSHHLAARLLAEGRSGVEVSLITGYSQSRLSILQRDPAFCELMEYYSGQQQEIYINVHERLASLGLDALEELHDRLLDPEEPKMTNKELRDLVELSFDRAGYGPKSTQVHEHTLGTSALLDAVKEAVRSRQNGSIKTLDVRPTQSRPSESGGLALGLDIASPAEQHPQLPPARSERGGEEVREESRHKAPGSWSPAPANENDLN